MAYIGFSTDVPVARLIAMGFVFGAAMVSLAVLAIAIGGTVSFRWRMDGAMLQAAAVQMAVYPIAALHEELMFRGYPFQRLTESIGAWPAVIIVSAALRRASPVQPELDHLRGVQHGRRRSVAGGGVSPHPIAVARRGASTGDGTSCSRSPTA